METKTLNEIQKLAKIARVICRIVFVFCIVGAALCLTGIVSTAAGLTGAVKLGGITIRSLIETDADLSTGSLYIVLVTGLIMCAGEIVLSKIAESYFRHEIAAGTPFTFDGAKELLRLGILVICIPMASMLLSAIATAVLNHCFGETLDVRLEGWLSVGLGVMMIGAALFCRHGAEIREKLEAGDGEA